MERSMRNSSNEKPRSARAPLQGVLNILRFNYEFFVTAACVVIACLFAARCFEGEIVPSLCVCCAAVTAFASLVSLAASWWVYDLSSLYSFSWLDPLLPSVSGPALNIHAGFDETSELLQSRYPHLSLEVMDFYDPILHTERSIRRARRVQLPYPGTQRVSPSTLVLEPDRYVAIFLILAVHEIRDAHERAMFMRTLRNALAPGGRLIVVEHSRDVANFMAYTIGFFHFLSVSSLLSAFSQGGFMVSAQRRITPFVRVFSLDRA
jgi:hypothetical protein